MTAEEGPPPLWFAVEAARAQKHPPAVPFILKGDGIASGCRPCITHDCLGCWRGKERNEGRKGSGINHHRREHYSGAHPPPPDPHPHSLAFLSPTARKKKKMSAAAATRCNIFSPPLIRFPRWRRARRGRSGREDRGHEGRGGRRGRWGAGRASRRTI